MAALCFGISLHLPNPTNIQHIGGQRKLNGIRCEYRLSRWSKWKTVKCRLSWDWQVDQLVICSGDLIRYPKWFEADLWFNAPYQELYSFIAYGDDYIFLRFLGMFFWSLIWIPNI
ncbi:hypothetical protein MKX01_007117 [Papaver californicum]|nr:hypothetical protein MKX01_007117 [Papaver californicum]